MLILSVLILEADILVYYTPVQFFPHTHCMKEAGLTNFYPAKSINVLMVEGAAMNAECKLMRFEELGDHIMFVGDVIEISADENYDESLGNIVNLLHYCWYRQPLNNFVTKYSCDPLHTYM